MAEKEQEERGKGKRKSKEREQLRIVFKPRRERSAQICKHIK